MVHGKLTALAVAALRAPGLHHVGDGLYLRVKPAGPRSWVYRYQLAGVARSMGLGPASKGTRSNVVITLAEARGKADEARKSVKSGVDPIDTARQKKLAAAADKGRTTTFKEAAEAYIADHKEEWRNAKHGAQWLATLQTYAFPTFGNVSVADVDRAMVLKALEKVWKTKNETARRVRGRVENILDAATVRGQRSGENPARWKLLQHVLARHSKAKTVQHQPALPYTRVGEFMAALRQQEGTAARCLEFTILTAARTSEAVGARWDEIDLEAGLWTVPADRIKAGRTHRVPLSAAVLAILKAQAKVRENENEYVFPGGRLSKPLSNMAMISLLKRMGRVDITVHGFRSSFRDWAAEQTNYAREIAEMALAHAVGDKVEAAYRRGDLLAKRSRLMADWGTYCGRAQRQGGNVVALARSRGLRRRA